MTDKLMGLVDQYVSDKVIDAECGYETNGDSGKSRDAIEEEVQAHIEYTRAVISERDALKAQLEKTWNDFYEIRNERNELTELMHKALDERDHYIGERDGLCAARMAYASEFQCDADGLPDVGSVHQNIRALKAERDKLTMVHAERTVERDRLREVAQRALEAFNRIIWDRPPGITTKQVERMESIALAGAAELQNALRKELGA